MYITPEVIKTAVTIMTGIMAIFGIIFSVYRWYLRQNKQEEDIKSLKEEQTVLCYGMLACLEGLKQLKCNGPVTDAHDRLEKHLNKTAHK